MKEFQGSRKLDIKRLKEFANSLPQDSILKSLILSQSDQMDGQELIIKLETWIEVANKELG